LKLPLRHVSVDRERRILVSSIFRIIEQAKHPATSFTAAVPLQRRAVLNCERQLLNLADDLKATAQPVNVEGIALVRRLLRGGASPLYAPLGDGALEGAVREARATLLLRGAPPLSPGRRPRRDPGHDFD
jgi:hypothetical protein